MLDRKKYNILVIEDSAEDFVLMEEFLMEKILNPHITHALNFKQASQAISEKGMYDIILLDLSLPDKSREQLIPETLQLAGSCPIVVLTGYTDINFSIQSIAQGVLDYLVKDDLSANSLYKSIIYSIERKKIISELKESEKRYSDLFYLSPQPKWVYDIETLKFVKVNNASVQLYGYCEEDFLSMTLMDIRSDQEVDKLKKWYKNKIVKSESVKKTAVHYTKSGDIIEVEMYISQIILNHQSFGLVVVIDVTERNMYEQKIRHSILAAQENERTAIGRDLHDNVNQMLGAIHLYIEMAKNNAASRDSMLADASRFTLEAIQEIRQLTKTLITPMIHEIGLQSAIEDLIKKLTTVHPIQINLKVTGFCEESTSDEFKLNVFRIVQEQLNNIIKHAKAQTAFIFIGKNQDKISLSISDDGAGFDSLKKSDGVGLSNIKNRIKLYNGKLDLTSTIGRGTALTIEFMEVETAMRHLND